MTPLGMIGLGLVGGALAERFLQAGYRVIGFDVDAQRRADLAALGGIVAANAQSVAAAADVCVLSLPTTAIVESVLAEITPALPGKTIVDTTTGEPDTTAAIGARLAQQGVSYLDATIVGSSKQVRAGDVIVLVGGKPNAFQSCASILACLARQAFYLGPCGSGARMKLVVNLVLGLNRAALAEGLAFARACGIEPLQALEILRAGAASSRVMETKGRKMVERDFSVEARLAQHHKDVHLILSAAKQAGIELPLSQTHERLLRVAETAGYADLDNCAIITAFDAPP